MERKWSNIMDLPDEELLAWHRSTSDSVMATPKSVYEERIRRDQVATAEAQLELARSQLELARELGRMTAVIMRFTVTIAVFTVIVAIPAIIDLWALIKEWFNL